MSSPYGEWILSTTPTLPGYKIKRIIGPVTGISARGRGLGGRIAAGIQMITGGKLRSYIGEIEKARKEALEDMLNKAAKMGANAVIGIDWETTELMEGVVLITVNGTAVVVEPET